MEGEAVNSSLQHSLPNPCLRVAVLTIPGVLQVRGQPGNLQVSGPVIHILTILSASLNTCLKYIAPEDNVYGARLPDGNWSGVLGIIWRKEADFSGSVMTLDNERTSGFTVSHPIHPYERIIIYTRPVPSADITGFIRPYTMSVWCMLLVTVVAVCVLLWVTQKLQAKFSTCDSLDSVGPGADSVAWSIPKDAAWTSTRWTVTAPLSQASAWLPEGWRVRTVTGLWLLMALVLSSVFRSNLKAMLILPRIRLPFNSMEELIQSRIPTFIYPDTVFHEAIKSNDPGNRLHQLESQMVDYANLPRAIHSLVTGRHAVIDSRHVLLSIVHTNFLLTRTCPLYIVHIDYKGGWYHMFFPKGSPLKYKIDPILIRLQESGILDKLFTDEVRHAKECLKPLSAAARNTLRPLELGDYYGIFTVYACGMVLACQALLLEKTLNFLIR